MRISLITYQLYSIILGMLLQYHSALYQKKIYAGHVHVVKKEYENFLHLNFSLNNFFLEKDFYFNHVTEM